MDTQHDPMWQDQHFFGEAHDLSQTAWALKFAI